MVLGLLVRAESEEGACGSRRGGWMKQILRRCGEGPAGWDVCAMARSSASDARYRDVVSQPQLLLARREMSFTRKVNSLRRWTRRRMRRCGDEEGALIWLGECRNRGDLPPPRVENGRKEDAYLRIDRVGMLTGSGDQRSKAEYEILFEGLRCAARREQPRKYMHGTRIEYATRHRGFPLGFLSMTLGTRGGRERKVNSK
ncbi:uncharacterized protein BDZ83DRAFT_615433 [Colletotrichum acutatum]|uniref:Uncharacterized protein n=1 Tax=Glomerella acutata TaxID=27357 RepID=A0AAD8XIR7_GLOAC|nr:uncharacterized protein BDZ83DRAFT_615433 [Colletotrichum acutatum]KAK1726538.1 hypothetical protein BDZ83DRAFT_615433 [Colletotrichum acutatum]